MRVLVGAIEHESNSFNPAQTRLEDFTVATGEELAQDSGRLSERAARGIIRELRRSGVEVVPTVAAWAVPGGLVGRDAYEYLKGILLRELEKQPVDGICLGLHGSMTVAGLGDGEGDLLRSIRERVGPDVPIVTALDMHATVTEAMIACADGFVGYRTAPHVDVVETGERAARLLLAALNGRKRLCMAAVPIPILVSGEQSESAKEPMRSLISELDRSEAIPGILSASYLLGFPWVDTEFNRGCALVVASVERWEAARQEALRLAKVFWERRRQFHFTTKAYPFEEALEVARKDLRGRGQATRGSASKGPVIIADSGDNPGAGGTQNTTYALERLLATGAREAANEARVLFAAVVDPVALRACQEAGVGRPVELVLGRDRKGPGMVPVALRGRVRSAGRARDVQGAVVDVDGVDVVIIDRRAMVHTDPLYLRDLGVEPRDYAILVLKSGYLDPKYESFASRCMLGLTPGCTSQDLAGLSYLKVQRPVYPLDEDAELTPIVYGGRR